MLRKGMGAVLRETPTGIEQGQLSVGLPLDVARSVRRALQSRVVERDRITVSGHLHVDVDHVTAERDAVLIRVQRVLRKQPNTASFGVGRDACR